MAQKKRKEQESGYEVIEPMSYDESCPRCGYKTALVLARPGMGFYNHKNGKLRIELRRICLNVVSCEAGCENLGGHRYSMWGRIWGGKCIRCGCPHK